MNHRSPKPFLECGVSTPLSVASRAEEKKAVMNHRTPKGRVHAAALSCLALVAEGRSGKMGRDRLAGGRAYDVFAADAESSSLLLDVLGILLVPALVVLNGLFVAAEFALVSVRKTRVEELVGQGVKGARSVLLAVSRLADSIAATQLGITLASIGLGFVGEPALAHLIRPMFTALPADWQGVATHSAASVIAFFLITFMHVVFGELIPKTMALQVPDRAALWLARPLLVFGFVARPLTLLMGLVANSLLRALKFRPATGEAMVHSVEELLLLIEDTEEAGILDPDQAELVENVFHLTAKKVRDCMVPRDKMATLELNSPPDRVLDAVRTGAHTRMPVYDGELDRIVGIVNTKDLFYLFSLNGRCHPGGRIVFRPVPQTR